MKKIVFILFAVVFMMASWQCTRNMNKEKHQGYIKQTAIDSAISKLAKLNGEQAKEKICRGVNQVALLWQKNDGKEKDFIQFCVDNYAGREADRDSLFARLETNFEILYGNFNRIGTELKRPLHVSKGQMLPIDDVFGAYDPFAHLNDDFFTNKIAFITILNFPCYTLEEKKNMGEKWTRKEWAYARIGDMFTSRIPANVLQKYSDAYTDADNYISNYNIYVGNLVDDKNQTLFPKDKILISHWGLRDELKANYPLPDGLAKQKMIYQVMLRIINQEIPDSVINKGNYQWNPYSNTLFKNGKTIEFKREDDMRYQKMLSIFNSLQAIDKHSPQYPTYIQRKFEQEMEIPCDEIEKLFTDFISSKEVKDVASLIKKRLNRNLEPFDIWYDGFKSRSSISEKDLDARVQAKYKNTGDFQNDLSNMLLKLQFTKEKAEYITSKVQVDPARGAGHALGTMMKGDKSYLRTRVPAEGWNYKGYNIACHEFGHNVEQTLSMYDVDYYSMAGVPNTGFTEALAFIFQKRDLELLGMNAPDPNKEYLQTLDNFWSCYEIMGVSLVDIKTWKWLYQHPKANKKELKEAVIANAKEVWNQYYAGVFGVKDCPILAIYSHMIDSPLYLSAYPVGQLVQFQVEEQLKGKVFADEIIRMYTWGRTIPDVWMMHAVGQKLSIKPILTATDKSLTYITK